MKAMSIPLSLIFQMVYCIWTFSRFTDMTRSQAGLAIGGVLLVIGTVAGGLGLCALIPLTQNFNAITTQVLPFIALAIGVNSMFSFVHVYYELATTSPLIVYEVSRDYHCKNRVIYYETRRLQPRHCIIDQPTIPDRKIFHQQYKYKQKFILVRIICLHLGTF